MASVSASGGGATPSTACKKAQRKAEWEIYQHRMDLEARKRWQLDERVGIPWNQDTAAALTDFYQITMAYAYWKQDKHEHKATFEVFHRKCPFGGAFTVLGGVNDVIRFVNTFKFDEALIHFLMGIMPTVESEFFEWLHQLDCTNLTIYSAREGSFVFPQEPVMRFEGPLALCQLLETTVLTLVNFASLICTNAARYRLAAGFDKNLLEFGLRRAQGPDGGMSASRFSFVGGFDATSNTRASFLFGLPLRGTHAHSYVTSFNSLDDLTTNDLVPNTNTNATPPSGFNFRTRVEHYKSRLEEEFAPQYLKYHFAIHDGELAAFIAYAQSFPNTFLALVDTYDAMLSGVPAYLAVALALGDWGYSYGGFRLDSGDLAYLSTGARRILGQVGEWLGKNLSSVKIVASNNIDEEVLHSLNRQGHAIDTFGIGTNLVTCSKQPALGMVFKLCEINHRPVMKLSQEIGKATLPYTKDVYRLYDKSGTPVLDIIDVAGSGPPRAGEPVYCQHPNDNSKRCYVKPARVESLLRCVWRKGKATHFVLAPVVSSTSNSNPPNSNNVVPFSTHGTTPVAAKEVIQVVTVVPDDIPERKLTEENIIPPEIINSTRLEATLEESDDSGSTDKPQGDDHATELQEKMSPWLIREASSTLPGINGFYDGKHHLKYLLACRNLCLDSLRSFREDHLRAVNPTPYKISVTRQYDGLHRKLRDETAPVRMYE